MIIQAIADAASAKGHTVASGERDTLVVVVDGQRYGVRIVEETGKRWTLRLALEINSPGEKPSRWVDYAGRRVEDDLSEVLAEMARRAASVRAERDAQQRAERQRLEEKRQRRIIKHRDKVLREQVAAWKLAQRIRAHGDQMVAAGMPADDSWIVWATAYAAEIDPLSDPPVAPPDPSSTQPPEAASTTQAMELPSTLPPAKPWHPNRRWYDG
jgi:hypothetical protein